MKPRGFIRNIQIAVNNSFFLSLLWVSFLFGVLCLTGIYVVLNPTVETFSVLGALLVTRIVYAGFTGE